MFTCEVCKDPFTEKRSLVRHQRTVKICIEIQKARQVDIVHNKYECNYCNKLLCSKDRLHYHMNICKKKNVVIPLDIKLDQTKNEHTPVTNKLEKMIDHMVQQKIDILLKTNEDKLVDKQKIKDLEETIDSTTKNYQSLLIKHNSTLKTHHYTKFGQGRCFYIIDSGITCECNKSSKIKFGIAGTEDKTIDHRLQNHRTLWPLLKVRFLAFFREVAIFEKAIKIKYEKEINPNGHEIIEVCLDEFMLYCKFLLTALGIDYKTIEDEKLQEYNDYVNTTIKPA